MALVVYFVFLMTFRWFAIICLVTGFLITELNTFYLKWGLSWSLFLIMVNWHPIVHIRSKKLSDGIGLTLLQVCNVGPSKSPPQPNTPPLHPALGRCKFSSLENEKMPIIHITRLPCAKHLNFWTTQNATNWAVKAGWWSLLLSRSCWSASSLGGRPSPSRCRGTSPFGGSLVRRSFWSTPLSSSTFSNPTMCRSRRRSTSGWDLRLEVQQVHIAVCKTIASIDIHSYDRDTSEAPRPSRCWGSKSWRRFGWWTGQWDQRGEERQVKLLPLSWNCLKKATCVLYPKWWTEPCSPCI